MNKYLPDNITPQERLIVALDFDTTDEAMSMVDALGDAVSFYKVGWQLFIGAGWGIIRTLAERGKQVFLDLKMNDIDTTITSAVANIPQALKGSIALLTIHGNGATVQAAKKGRKGNDTPRLLMITALSSMDEADMRDVYATIDATLTTGKVIDYRARMALDAGCEGLIASGESVSALRQQYSDREFLIVTPGIRPPGAPHDEHKRHLTPYQAIIDGADYLVVGRPITRADDPLSAAKAIIADIERGLG